MLKRRLRTALLAGITLAFFAISPLSANVAAGAQSGSLRIVVVGLTGKPDAKIDVLGPDGFKTKVKRTELLENLKPGQYTVTAKAIQLETSSLAPTVSQSPIAVEAG